jgi:WD40 repeat protein
MARDRLEEWLAGWEEENLSAAEMEALAEGLERDPEARAQAVRQFTFSSALARALRLLHQEEGTRNQFSEPSRTADGGGRMEEMSAIRIPPSDVRPRGRLPVGIKRLVAGLAAALLVLAIWALWDGTRQAPAAVIARLEAVHGEVYQLEGAARSPVQAGREIRSGQGLETGEDSTAVLTFSDGTRLQLGADTILAELTDGAGRGKRVDLVEGSVRAEVARQEPDRPMLLTTPRAELTGQGTRFLVCSGPGATHLELEQGLVRLVRRDDQQAIEVEAGFYAVVATDAEPLRRWPLPPRVRTPRRSLDGRFTSLAFAPDSKVLATGTNGQVDLWDPHSGKHLATHGWNGEWVHALAYAPDGKTLALGGKNSRGARLWQVGTEQFVQLGGGGMIHRLAFSPDGRTLALSRAQPSFQLWDAVRRVERWTLSGHTDAVTGLAFGPDNRTLASGSEDGTVKLWDVAGGQELATLAAGIGPEKSRKANRVLAVAFAPDGQTVAAGFRNGTILLWDLAARKPRASLRQHVGPITTLVFAPDGKLLVSGSKDRMVKLWDPVAAVEEVTLLGHDDWIVDLALSPDGKTLASIGKDQKANLWSVAEVMSR